MSSVSENIPECTAINIYEDEEIIQIPIGIVNVLMENEQVQLPIEINYVDGYSNNINIFSTESLVYIIIANTYNAIIIFTYSWYYENYYLISVICPITGYFAIIFKTKTSIISYYCLNLIELFIRILISIHILSESLIGESVKLVLFLVSIFGIFCNTIIISLLIKPIRIIVNGNN